MIPIAIKFAVATLPAGPWAVGVSGGADSVALLFLLNERPDLALHVVHLDHQTRGAESTGDADFVRRLADHLKLPSTIALRSEVEQTMTHLPTNLSERYRIARLALFGKVVHEKRYSGVVLAHHADDQAETVLQRLLRGSGPMGLAAIQAESEVGGLRIIRPLLGIRSVMLRRYLQNIEQTWREDSSNASDAYERNRLRRFLQKEPEIAASLLTLGKACGHLRQWTRMHAVKLPPAFGLALLANQPPLLAHESARAWLINQDVPAKELVPGVIDRLLNMARDGASAAAETFPGGICVRRRKGIIAVQSSSLT